METKPRDFNSARGNQPTAGNPPVGLPTAGASDVQAPATCSMAEVECPGLGGSSLLDSADRMSTDDLSSVGTLTQSMESLLTTDQERAGKPSAITVNPGPTVKAAATDAAAVGNVSPAAASGTSNLTKRQRRRLRRRKARATAPKAVIAEGAVGSKPTFSTPDVGVKRTRSEEDTSKLDQSADTGASGSASAGRRRKKRRKVNKTTPSEPSHRESVKETFSTDVTAHPIAGSSAVAGPSGVASDSTGRSVVPGKSFSEAASEALIAQIESGDPRKKMTKHHLEYVEANIWKCLGEAKVSPKFEGIVAREESLVVRCSDEKSLEWLKNVVAKMPACEGVKFILKKSSDLPKLVRATVWIPGKPRDSREIVARFRVQNPELNTKYWRVYAHSTKGKGSQTSEGSTLVLGIDPGSVEVLRSKYGLRPYLFLGRVKFNISQKEQKGKG